MPYFKERPVQKPKQPFVHHVWLVQLVVVMVLGAGLSLVNPYIGGSFAAGGLISVLGQVFYSFRALKNFGSRDSASVVAGTFTAVIGKWLIIVLGSIAVVLQVEQISASALYVGLFGIHSLSALLLPVLIK